MQLGVAFEREIFEQPDVWERVARSNAASALAAALAGDVVLVGSGSSFFAAQAGALALRRRGVVANAVAATEVAADHRAYEGRTVVAISQSGRSSDLLGALALLRAARIVALTNTVESPLSARAEVTIDVGAGPELAIPATKSITATLAILLGAASLLAGGAERGAAALTAVAKSARAWLSDGAATLREPASAIAHALAVVILGTDYGVPVAREGALKFKEAAYVRAEGFAAGEFRHGSSAMLDANAFGIGLVDRDGAAAVGAALDAVADRGAARLAIGAVALAGVARAGPIVDDAYDALAWLLTLQLLALYAARECGVDSDAPRGLTKSIDSPP